MIKKIISLLIISMLFILSSESLITTNASSHREGAIISTSPEIDNTDTYIFRTDYHRNYLGVGDFSVGTDFDINLDLSGTYLTVITGDGEAVAPVDTDIVKVEAKNIEHWCKTGNEGKSYQSSGFSKTASYLVVDVGWPSGNVLPTEAKGMWISTNASDWQISPISDSDGDGKKQSIKLNLTGKTGVNGFFKIFWPTALLSKWKLTKSNLAGYFNSDRVKSTITKNSAGILVTVHTPFESTNVFSSGKATPLSLTLNNKKIKKGRKAKMYGWVSPKAKGMMIGIFRKLKGERNFSKVASRKTNKNGYFSYSEKLTKTASFKAVVFKGKKKITSKVKKITAM